MGLILKPSNRPVARRYLNGHLNGHPKRRPISEDIEDSTEDSTEEKKSIKTPPLRFNDDMYTHPVGSLVISCYILKPEKCESLGWLKKRWVQYKKRVLVNNEDLFNNADTFIEEVRDYFRLPKEELPICYVQSSFNFLFLPYVTNNKDEIFVLPIREDGQYPQTWYRKIDYRVLDWKGVFNEE